MKKIIIILIVIATIGGGYYYKSQSTVTAEKEYDTFIVKKSTFEKIVEANGVIQARDSKRIYVDKSMKVNEVFYTTGDYVKKGETILTFDQSDKNNIARNLRKEEISLTKLQRDLKHEKELLSVGGTHKVKIQDLEFDIEKSKLLVEGYKEELDKTLDSIKSPFNGTITSMIAEANYRVNTQVELFEISDLSDLIVTANIPEYSINGIATGQIVRIKADASTKNFTGKVSKLSTLSSATQSSSSNNGGTQTTGSTTTEAYVAIEITLDEVPKEMRPGFNTKIEIITDSRENIITIPRTAVLEDEKGYYVFILSADDTNEIKKGYINIVESNNNVMIISNLRDGVKVLKNPFVALKDGDSIKENQGGQGTGAGNGSGQGRGKKGESDNNG